MSWYRSRDPRRALTYGLRFLKDAQSPADSAEQAEMYTEMGNVYLDQGLYRPAIEAYARALAGWRHLHRWERAGWSYNDLGYVYDCQKQPQLARTHYRRGAALFGGWARRATWAWAIPSPTSAASATTSAATPPPIPRFGRPSRCFAGLTPAVTWRTRSATWAATPWRWGNRPLNNLSRRPSRRVRFDLSFTYETTVQQLEPILGAITDFVQRQPKVVENETLVRFNSLTASAKVVSIKYYIGTESYTEYMDVVQAVNFEITRIVARAGAIFANTLGAELRPGETNTTDSPPPSGNQPKETVAAR